MVCILWKEQLSHYAESYELSGRKKGTHENFVPYWTLKQETVKGVKNWKEENGICNQKSIL